MDSTDRQILDLLRSNARLSYAELGRQIGLSPPAVHDRVSKLESTGVILGYRTLVEPETIGLGVTALVGIVQTDSSEADDIAAELTKLPEVESCYYLAGQESFLCKVRVGTIAQLEVLIGRLNRVPGVARTHSTIALSTKWENRPQPLTDPDGEQ
ncbi:AsnC family transcriptional regulator [Actinocatenispora thailandica]|uniref:AsnC family transcriptional regulator n=1 Tax=Actinocatenispora thailandica TaxID=227318 RepID=A0A7R7DJF0_9ACTN|nr:Lrp/AsnC family transcriptional regulator [Actinocatenispora thailandica]BCJ32581.1 AsnC family transcriptional regulator [Actinocatenispora thailandica]